ncbi:bacteriohemerythrin [Candidatus Colwellia aromaticivorans]|uniref:bacteriohemerythrin n=1 Tax=Candidatus Colwellia aromaticivorans TaxID=2267621 RepID=UPI000DF222B1|nr:bacteriohemerythrin [Candidatus Colwellia aromaticivorans]
MSALTKTINMFLLSVVIMALLVVVILGFMLGIGHPLPWVIIVVLIIIPVIHDKLIKKRCLVWHSSMATGIELVDNDHKQLINLINKFQEATEFNISEQKIHQALDEVVNYTKYHFHREEALMRINHYPAFEAHQQQHQQMIDKISHYIGEYKTDKSLAIDHVLHFLQTWLIKHIKGSDQEYVPYLTITSLPAEMMQGEEDV